MLSLVVSSLVTSGLLSFVLYQAFGFILPIRAGGVWGLAIGSVFAWTLFFSLRQRFPKVIQSNDEVKVLRAKHPLPQLIAARISVLSIAVTRSAALILGFYLGIVLWALIRIQVDYIRFIAQLSSLACFFAIGILVAGIYLERLCSPPSGNGIADSKQTT